MKRKNRYLIPIFAFSSSFLLANISYSAWNVSNGSPEKEFVFNVSNKNSVAYFYDTKNIKREFGSVAGALAVAANYANDSNKMLVVVNPDTTGNVKIGDCTIAANVTLLINYKDVKSKKTSDDGFTDEYTANADGQSFGDFSGSKSKITLNGKRAINNGGTLIIGGETGINGSQLHGGTLGKCAELNVDAGGSIDCSGEIISYGFIHDLLEGKRGDDESAIVIHKKGKVSEPLTRYTWPGGSSADKLHNKNIFPCNVFDLNNIRAPRLFEYQSTFTGIGKAYSSTLNKYLTANASIITSDNNTGFIQLQSGSGYSSCTGKAGSVLFNADDKNSTSTNTDYTVHKTKIKTNGDFSFSGVSISVGVKLDTTKGYLPISGIFDITVGAGFGEVKYSTKLLPGAALKIEPNAFFQADGNFIAYQSKVNKDGKKILNYNFTSASQITNQGKFVIKSGFDGRILSKDNHGVVVTESTYKDVSDCREMIEGSSLGFFGKLQYATFNTYYGANRNRLAQRYAIDGTTSYISKGNENAVADRTYISSATSDGKYGWTYNNEYKSYPIVIDTNGNDSAVDSNGQKYIENYGSGTVVLSNLTSKNPDKTFAGFYYDQACTKALKTENDSYIVELSVAVGYVNNGILTIYSKWIIAGLITVNQYKGQNDLTTTQSSLTSGKTYHLSDFNITGNDSRPMKKVDKVSRTEFVFQNWIIYDASDVNKSNKLSSDGSFTPESGKSYNLEPVFKTNYYLYRSVTQNSWKSFYRMHNFKVTGGDVPQDSSEKNKMFSATAASNSETSTTYTSGWISLNATIAFVRESRTDGGPNYVHISIGSNEKMQVKGNKNNWWNQSSNLKSCTIALSQHFNEDFVNGNGPISFKADNNESSNVQTI